VKNSQIDGTVINEVGPTHYGPFTVTDTTIGPANGCIGQPGLGESSYTASRVLIRGHDDGFRVSGNNIDISDSYAVLCYLPPSVAPPDGSHSDGIQAYCPIEACGGVVFDHNTIDASRVPTTNSVNLTDPQLSGVTVKENLLMGGAYVIDANWHSGPSWTFTDNRIVNKSWAYGPASTEGTCSHQAWSGNGLVTIDRNYKLTSAPVALPCIE
jgi:hypothetical protein